MRVRSQVQLGFAAMVLISALVLAGCPKRPEVIQAARPPPAPPRLRCRRPARCGGPAPAPAPSRRRSWRSRWPGPRPAPARLPPAPRPAGPRPAPLKDVFFDFDKASIRDDQKAALNDNVAG